jgi:formylglycine-generating enzyme
MLLDRTYIQELFSPPELSQLLIEHPKTGMLMVWVPPGKFTTDTGGGAPFAVDLPGFHMGVHPVTNRQYAQFVSATGHRPPDNQFWQKAAKAEHPVTDVSWDDATACCQWAGLRLPGELEWEKAARWTDGRLYPWGREWDQARCRNNKNKGNETTAGVWRYATGTGGFGGYQLSGNVWEWCADWYDSDAYTRYRQGNLTPPSSGQSRVLRGGSWRNDHPGNVAASYRYDRHPGTRLGGYGIRCVSGVGVSP